MRQDPFNSMKCLHGTEHESNELKYDCREARIKRETTTTHNPRQNGVFKRKDRTIIEAT